MMRILIHINCSSTLSSALDMAEGGKTKLLGTVRKGTGIQSYSIIKNS